MNKNPNIIIIISHDTGRHISPYGIKTVKTPNLEKLAGNSLLFTQAFSTTPQCSPARAALFSGKYPHTVGVMGNTGPDKGWNFPDDQIHASHIFRKLGYQNWLLGMMDESYTPEKLAFDTIEIGFPGTEVAEHLDQLLQKRDRNLPVYCQIGTYETHRPFDRFGTEPDDSLGITVPGYLHNGPGTRRDLAGLQGMVKRLDQAVGDILQTLADHELDDNTILVVTSDHGVSIPHAKGTLYDSGTGIFLFMRYPGGGWITGKTDESISHVDILPTILDELGEEITENMQGRSIRRLLKGQSIDSQPVFTEKTHFHFYDPMRSIRTGKYKYIKNFEFGRQTETPADYIKTETYKELNHRYSCGHPEDELYDIEKDPDELNNLADDPGYHEIMANLEKQLFQWMKDSQDPLLDGPIPSPFYERIIAKAEKL